MVGYVFDFAFTSFKHVEAGGKWNFKITFVIFFKQFRICDPCYEYLDQLTSTLTNFSFSSTTS